MFETILRTTGIGMYRRVMFVGNGSLYKREREMFVGLVVVFD